MGIYKSIDGGLNWDTVSINTGFNSITFHPGNPDTIYATMGSGSFSDGIYKSIDQGNNWDVLDWIFGATSLSIPAWTPGTMFVGSKSLGVLKSINFGTTWTQMNDSLDNLNVLAIVDVYPITIPEDPIIEYVVGTEGGIFYYPDHVLLGSADEYWHNTNTATNAMIPAISSEESGNYLWAAIGGGSWSDGMYNSIDLGGSWDVSEYWPYITDILINPINPNTVYASDSSDGVKRTINGGISWETINNDLGDSLVYCLAQSPADTLHLYAGTEHGLYVYDFTTSINETNNIHYSNIKIFPNPANNDITIKITGNECTKAEIYDLEGQILKSAILHNSETNINIDNINKGIYLLKIYSDKEVITRKLIKQ
ncbi:MAG: T9SS type A sorting domain-containing protein [Bacteroidota bacterium]